MLLPSLEWRTNPFSLETSELKVLNISNSAPYLNPLAQKEHFIVYMIIHISCKGTRIKLSLKKRPSSAIRPAMS